jgi:glutamate-ammonia-ligase adenylyltransferase
VFDDDDERAPEIYAAFVRKLINWLTVKTGEGDLYEIDTACAPMAAPACWSPVSMPTRQYQQQRGSNTAWTWEHQAMTRARFVLGSAALQARFDAVREAVITSPRDPAALRAEIVAMRERVRSAHRTRDGQFDVKHSPGGMVDAEFAVQYLVLANSASHPELVGNVGNIALLQRAEQVGLLPAGVGHAAADAYRELRRVQHRARLDEVPTQVAPRELATERDAVTAFCKAVFG